MTKGYFPDKVLCYYPTAETSIIQVAAHIHDVKTFEQEFYIKESVVTKRVNELLGANNDLLQRARLAEWNRDNNALKRFFFSGDTVGAILLMAAFASVIYCAWETRPLPHTIQNDVAQILKDCDDIKPGSGVDLSYRCESMKVIFKDER